ncbi:MAG: ATP-dependent DNA helicase [Ferroplasma sp.]|uniref:ATP-dependent DNA helicase n=1 Tax=Ferroplasma sp. TaxID=2591003 RepID=UPI002815865C|nr:ATP-dependent DNA helicase [Ferroplasma sp.]WMT51000.1 MAG: ATP-dependent DNA helicase [Ferroplasma sp.]
MINKDTLVISNPGTGKTTRIADEVVHLIEEGVSPDSILCITFTNNAVAQLQDTINKKLLSAKITGYTAYDINIYTFHALAFNHLPGIKSENSIISYNLARYLIYKKLRELKAFNYGRDYVVNEIVPKLENAIRYIKSFGITPVDIENHREEISENIREKFSTGRVRNISGDEEQYLFDYFYQAFKYYEEKKGNLDFNDLLFEFQKFRGKKIYKYVFVDELQDINDIEASIAKSSGEIKFMVGDRKQSIFGFQGGALSVFNSLLADESVAKENMKTNYRSTDTILKYSKNYYMKFEKDAGELENFRGVHERGDKVTIIQSESPEESLINRISEITSHDGTTGIIARTNAQIDMISTLLDKYNIDYSSDSNVHSVNEAKRDITLFLRGIFYDANDDILSAMVTPFSGLPLKEAFEISESLQGDDSTIDRFDRGNPFFSLRNMGLSREGIKKLFDTRILPVAASISPEYFLTASTVKSSIDEFFQGEKEYTRENFFDFLDLSYSENGVKASRSKLVLTTVHKAKGREFDRVVYLPKKPRVSDAYIDLIVSSIIETVKGIDVDDELKNESIRIDFVAFTRAREKLWICASTREAPTYLIPEYSDLVIDEAFSEKSPVPDKTKYDEAYFQFVSGNHEASEKIIKQNDGWLREKIYEFFKSKNVLSYSLISLDNPYWLLKNNILKLNEKTEALYYGLNAHEMAESLYKGEIQEEILSMKDRKVLDNIEAVINQIKSTYGVDQIESEVSVIARVNQMFPEFSDEPDSIMFYGKLDAVFGNGKKYVILDYKTDKTTERSSHHRVQLLAYRILYAIKNSIDVNNIDIAIGYISLRGKINTGENSNGIDFRQPDKRSLEQLKKYISRFLRYKNNPDEFISDYLSYPCDDTLYRRLADLLK